MKKSSLLEKKLKNIDKEISLVNSEMKTLSKFVEKPGKLPAIGKLRSVEQHGEARDKTPNVPHSPQQSRPSASAAPRVEQRQHKDTNKVYEERFADYLASSFQTVQVLRHERRIQRNKAIVMIIVVLFVLWALIYHLFL